jgi:hypothetical protein
LPAEAVEQFEREYGVVLPAEFAAFLTEAGNGGLGPDYGLLPLDRTDAVARGAGLPTAGYFAEPFDMADGRAGGALAVGETGSGRYTVLIVTGPDRGRLAAVDTDPGPAFPLWDAGFLSWYERWLAEAAAGCRMAGFSASMPGTAAELAALVRRDEDTRASVAALRGLSRRPDSEPADLEVLDWAAHRARDAATRTAAVDALAVRAGGAADSEAADAMLAALLARPDDAPVVERTLRHLAGRAGAVADLVLRLCDAPDPGVRAAALAASARSGLLTGPTLLAGLADQDPGVRLEAVGQAPRSWSDQAARVVAGLTADPDPRVRAHAMQVLKRRRLLTRELLAPLLADPDEFVRRRAAQAAAAL